MSGSVAWRTSAAGGDVCGHADLVVRRMERESYEGLVLIREGDKGRLN